MKLTFISNFFNHHQEAMCNEFFAQLGDNFTFIATKPVDEERLTLGYEDSNSKYPYILKAYASKENHLLTKKLMIESDVVIHGSAPLTFLIPRLNKHKLTFIYSEHFFKKSFDLLKIRTIWYSILYHGFYRDRVSILCSSGYLPKDLRKIHYSNPHLYKWGYFPKTIEYTKESLKSYKSNPITQILWVGRFIDWKHPEYALEMAAFLKEKQIPFHLTMIGDGILNKSIRNLIVSKQLQEEISLLGPLHYEEVRKQMEHSHILLFTSDQNEGWGAVVNEAMNSGCVVIASRLAGSVPFLFHHGSTVYNTQKELFNLTFEIIQDKTKQWEIAWENYTRIYKDWNAKTAVQNLFKVIEAKNNNQTIQFFNQPCELIHHEVEKY